MNARRPKPATVAPTLPTLATLIAGAALSSSCQRAEAHPAPTAPVVHAPAQETVAQETMGLVQAQRAVPNLPPAAMTIPVPPEPPREEVYYGGAMAMVRPSRGLRRIIR